MPSIYFKTENVTVSVANGATILDGARKSGVIIEAPCSGAGTCGKCKVRLAQNFVANVIENANKHTTQSQNSDGVVLACQTKVFGDIEVDTILRENNDTLKILSSGDRFDIELDSFISKTYVFENNSTTVFAGENVIGTENGNTTDNIFGAAVDIGTTTIVVSVIDLKTGEEIGSDSALNPQAVYAQDVLSRIKLSQDYGGLEKLNSVLINKLNEMIETITKQQCIRADKIYEVVYSGNTCMLHLAVNVSPASLGKYPYTPKITGGNYINASSNGLNISSFGVIYLPPIISAYVGADITSGILASQLKKRRGTTLFVDIGTNGEMVIARDGNLSATSTAAGPAFEGMNITCGMRAANGAIEYFNIENGNVSIKAIGNMPPQGICGSGLLDIAGELVASGVIGKTGRFEVKTAAIHKEIAKKLIKHDGKTVFEIENSVILTQKDIRQIQLAKGAVRAGIEYLLKSVGVKANEVDSVLIAGSFGFHLRAKSLINIGLLPDEFEGKISFVGNTSKTGGEAFLLNKNCKTEMENIVQDVKVLELANYKDFDKLFVDCLSF